MTKILKLTYMVTTELQGRPGLYLIYHGEVHPNLLSGQVPPIKAKTISR